MIRQTTTSIFFFLILILILVAAAESGRDSEQRAGLFDFLSPGDEYVSTTTTDDEVEYCECPYKVIVVGGKGSTEDHPMFDWMEENVGDIADTIPLEGEDGEISNSDLEDEIDEAMDTEEGEEKQKVLIISHSIGSARVNNIVNDNSDKYGECVETIALDPPLEHRWCRGFKSVFPRIFNEDVRNICAARGDGLADDDNTVDWTGGDNGSDPEAHDPFSFPNAPGSQDRLDELKQKIEDVKNACERSVCPDSEE